MIRQSKIVFIVLLVGALVYLLASKPVYKRPSLLTVPYKGFVQTPKAKHSPIIKLHNSDGEFFCTGFVIDNRYAITAAHCVDQTNLTGQKGLMTGYIDVRSLTGEDTKIRATAAGMESRRDFAIIVGDFSNFKKVEVYTGIPDITEFSNWTACGFPSGQNELVCSAYKPDSIYYFMVSGQGYIYPGMSGGPVFDRNTGRVVGINSRVTERSSVVAVLIGIFAQFALEPKDAHNVESK